MFAQTCLLLSGMQQEGKQLRLNVCLLIYIKIHNLSYFSLKLKNKGKSSIDQIWLFILQLIM